MRQAADQLMGTIVELSMLSLLSRSPLPRAMVGVHSPGLVDMLEHLSFLH
jgi:hypothetical protein